VSFAIAESVPCRYCGRPICFDEHVKNKAGNMVALDPDFYPHRCWKRGRPPVFNDEEAISAAIEYIAFLNRNLKTAELSVVRKEKQHA
jgi:hypothetical protein